MSWFDAEQRGSDRDREREKTVNARLCVGKKYPVLANGESGYALEYSNGAFILCALSEGWKPEVLERFTPESGTIICWAEMGGMGYLCVKFGELPWGYCPFHPARLKLQGRNMVIPAVGEYKGIMIYVVCADSNTGEILKIRRIELPQKFSAAWMAWMNKASVEEMTGEEYANRVNTVCNYYTAAQLAELAELRYAVSNEERRGNDD